MDLNFFSLTFLLILILCKCSADEISKVQLQIGESTQIPCNFTAKKWVFKNKVISEGKKHSILEGGKILLIHKTDYNDEGNYTCEADQRIQSLIVKGKPRFKIASSTGRIDVKSIHVKEGSTIDMICYIPNKPEIPQDELYNFVWYKGNTQIKANLKQNRSHILVIENVDQSHRDTYACTADNGVSQHTEYIQLRVKDTYAYIWPLFGIICEIVILVVVIVIFENRSVKQENEESENDTTNDSRKKSN